MPRRHRRPLQLARRRNNATGVKTNRCKYEGCKHDRRAPTVVTFGRRRSLGEPTRSIFRILTYLGLSVSRKSDTIDITNGLSKDEYGNEEEN